MFIDKIKKFFSKNPKKDLRQLVIDKFGEEYGEMYDSLNRGIPIGGFLKTISFLNAIEEVKKENNL